MDIRVGILTTKFHLHPQKIMKKYTDCVTIQIYNLFGVKKIIKKEIKYYEFK